MTFKNAKTILFASLIAAMILPFSGMMMAEAAPNDKAKDRYNHKVEILSKEVISEEIVNGVKITKFKQTVKRSDLPTLEEFKEFNVEYFENLSKKEQTKILSEFAKNRANTPEVYEVETTKIGDHSITFETFTRNFPSTWGAVKDPINLVFYDEGSNTAAKSIIDNYALHNWHTTSAQGLQWTFIDETSHGGWAYWAYGDGYEEGDYDDRYHVRIFSGGVDTHSGGFGTWSIGAVHHEYAVSGSHVHYSDTWESSENHIAGDLASASGIGVISSINLSNSGSYNTSSSNNGYAALIQVQ